MKYSAAISAAILLIGFIETQAYPTDCKGVTEEQIVLLPNPGNCSTYIECVFEDPVVMPCPEGLHWNNAAKQCDFPEIAKCEKRTITRKYTNCNGVPSNIDVLLPNPSDCGSYIQCVHGNPMVRPCPSGLHWSVAANRCEWPEIANCKRNSCEGVPETVDVLLPNPEDCGSYIQCVHQKPVVRPCPGGLHWSVEANRCEWPNVAKCNATYTVTPKKNWTSCEGVPENEIVLLPTPGNCSTYIECTYEKPVVMPCPEGLHWNNADKQCDYPEIAKCEEKVALIPKKNWTSCFGVPNLEIVLLPNPKNCSTYFECVHKSPVEMPCPEGLKWNDAEKQCDFPEIAKCVEKETFTSKKNWTSCEGVPEDEIVLLPTPGNCTTYIECTYEEPVVMSCPEGLHWNDAAKQCDFPENAKCEEKKQEQPQKTWTSCDGVPSSIDVLLPNPSDCGSYIQCVHGNPMVRPCPSGLHWSVAANRCEWPEIANCKRNTCEGVPETVDVLLPNPEDCGSYIQCVHQKPVVRPCPGGLHWSIEANRCEWPNIANCQIVNP